MPKTLQEKFSIALIAEGFTEQKPTAHYRVFRGEYNGAAIWYYLGSSGALRQSRSGKVGNAIVTPDKRRQQLLNLLDDRGKLKPIPLQY